jgi:tetratricopeptide (TPR) repeat protein
MLFDIRGRRKHVIRVVYAILALLMGASLFLVVGPVNIGSLLGTNSGSGTSAAKQYEEQAERIERRLAKDPGNADQLLALTRARINAGNSLIEVNANEQAALTSEGRQQYEQASEAWSDYLEAADKPSVTGAQQMAQTLFVLAQNSRTGNEAEANVKAATEAQQIVASERPSLNSLSTLALFTMFTFDYAAANKAGKEALKFAENKFQRENFENQLEEVEKRAKEFQKQLAAAKKASKEAGSESLENPLSGGLSGGGLGG